MKISRVDHETFEIARAKAGSPVELERINQFFSRLVAIGPAEDAATRQILANKASRGEKVRPLTKSEKAFVDDLQDDGGVGLHPLIRQSYEKMAGPGEVLKIVAHSALYGAALIRQYLSTYHPEDRAVERGLLELHESLGQDLLDFIGDDKFAADERRMAAKESIPTDGGGGDVYVLLEVENDRDTTTTGKAIGRAFSKLDEMATDLSVTPLWDFFGFGERGSGDWFPAEDGLRTVTALIEHLKTPAAKLKGKKIVIAELQELLGVLMHGQELKTRFHIEIDV